MRVIVPERRQVTTKARFGVSQATSPPCMLRCCRSRSAATMLRHRNSHFGSGVTWGVGDAMRSALASITNLDALAQPQGKGPVQPLHAAAPVAETADLSSSSCSWTQAYVSSPVSLRAGAIELIMGPMFAGKTTQLLQRVEECERAGLSVLLVKSCTDDRYATEEVVSHAGKRRRCHPVSRLHQVANDLYPLFLEADVVAVDETQFLPDAAWFAQWAADKHRKVVIMAGLDGDYKRKKFGQMLDIVPCADRIVKLSAQCQYCKADGRHTPALFTLRKVADDRQEVVGGAETYAPVCRRCYLSLSQMAEWSGADSETSSLRDEVDSPRRQ